MSEERICLRCGGALPGDLTEAECPKCLLNLGFESQTGPAEPAPTDGSPYQPTFVPPTPEELAGRFPQLEIVGQIGFGGMGVVYQARQKELDREVALKILRPEIGSDPEFAERFVREARALAKLNHPTIVTVHDFGREDGLFYFIMEFVDGANLRQLARSNELTPQEALAIVPKICEALQYAHDQGVVHRDIKPENILIDREGRVKIADFGLAKMARQTAEEFTLTGSWQVMGTPHYMAPEQMERPAEVDHRADIFSLGVVIYEMLTGELPLGRFAPPSNKVQVDVRLDDVVLRALEKEPERRYQQATEMKTDVEAVADDYGKIAVANAPHYDEVAADVRLPAIGLLIAGLLDVAAVLFAAWMAAGRPPGQNPVGPTEGILIGACSVVGFPIILGAVYMLKRIRYDFARLAAALAVVPCAAAFAISLPFGIWALIILHRPDVKAAFQRRNKKRREEK